MKRLTGRVLPRAELSDTELLAMFEIFSRHYEQVTWLAFLRDLQAKDYVILLEDAITGEPRGFSTQQIIRVHGVRAIFSGDTIIDRAYWGEQELVRTWCRFAGQVLATAPDVPLYWFLISKGYRTYLFLPLFYREFFPRRDVAVPPYKKALMDALAFHKFGDAYDPRTGVVRFPRSQGHLARDLAEVPPARRKHPDVEFFLSRNPGYAAGDELVCLAR